jgi:hypothetical protein
MDVATAAGLLLFLLWLQDHHVVSRLYHLLSEIVVVARIFDL